MRACEDFFDTGDTHMELTESSTFLGDWSITSAGVARSVSGGKWRQRISRDHVISLPGIVSPSGITTNVANHSVVSDCLCCLAIVGVVEHFFLDSSLG